MQDKRSAKPALASGEERRNNDWVQAQPADVERHEALRVSVTLEQAMLEGYPGTADSLAALAGTLGIAWAEEQCSERDQSFEIVTSSDNPLFPDLEQPSGSDE